MSTSKYWVSWYTIKPKRFHVSVRATRKSAEELKDKLKKKKVKDIQIRKSKTGIMSWSKLRNK